MRGMQHGKGNQNRWSHKDAGISHQGRTDLDPDDMSNGMTQSDVMGRPGARNEPKPRKRT
jgi:hypothetical protein